MDKQVNTAQSATNSGGLSPSTTKRFTRYLLGFCVLFIVSAISFCPVTQAALANVLPTNLTGLSVSFEAIAHLAFFGLLVIGLRMRTKY